MKGEIESVTWFGVVVRLVVLGKVVVMLVGREFDGGVVRVVLDVVFCPPRAFELSDVVVKFELESCDDVLVTFESGPRVEVELLPSGIVEVVLAMP